jgi:N-acetylglucosamine-6-phosphate deacetylase
MRIESPGFFDLQVNGFAGVDFNTPGCTGEQLQHATDAMRATGVTRYLPTLITSSFDRFASCAKALVDFAHLAIAGLHMEGPYISVDDGPRGAHPPEYVVGASIEDFNRRQDAAGGRIVLVTLAPEAEGALRLIEYLVQSNIRVAIGHAAASAEQIRDAIKAGATLSTHLGNGCANLLPRHPNMIWEQLAADELLASFIVDGHHLPPATVKAMIRAKSPSRSILVTDATAAAMSPPGSYRIGEARIVLSPSGRVAEPGASNLAGSSLTMDEAVVNSIRFAGVSIDEALAMASIQPALYIGDEPAGRISVEWDPDRCHLAIDAVTRGD